MKVRLLLSTAISGLLLLAASACEEGDNGTGPEEVAPPTAPGNVEIEYQASDLRNRVTWQDNSDDEDGFIILKSEEFGPWEEAGSRDPDGTSFIHSNVEETKIYSYRVYAFKSSGDVHSDTTDSVGIQIPLHGPVQLSSHEASGGIQLGWSDQSGAEDGFHLERKTGSGGWTPLVVTNENEVTYLDEYNFVVDTTYSYRVFARAVAHGEIVYSDTSDVTSTTWQGLYAR
jgi:hypothetical protein